MPTRRKRYTRAKRRRQRDFAKRLAADSGNPIALAAYRCVLVHPLADDHKLLASMDWSSEQCTSVDAYWRFGDDIAFLQVCSSWPGSGKPGLYAQREAFDSRLTLTAILDDGERIDSLIFCQVLNRFSTLRWKGAPIFNAVLRPRSLRVGDLGIVPSGTKLV